MSFSGQFGSVNAAFGKIEFGILGGGSTLDADATSQLNLTQTVHFALALTIPQTITFTDQVISGDNLPVDADNTITFTHSADVTRSLPASATNTLTFTQAASVEVTLNKLITQHLTLTQAASREIDKVVFPAHTITFTQVASAVTTKAVTNTLTITQSADVLLVKKASNTLIMDSVAAVSITLTKSTHHVFVPFHAATVHTTLNKAVAQTLNLTQVASATVTKFASNTLNLTQSCTVTNSKNTSNLLEITQVCTVNKLVAVNATNALLLVQTFQPQFIRQVHAHDILAFDQNAAHKLILTHAAQNTIVFSQDLVRVRTNEDLSQTIVFTQAADVVKVSEQTIEQNLEFIQEATVSMSYNRTATNTLVFKEFFTKPVVIGDVTEVNIPQVQVVLVKPFVILQSPQTSIVLPPPEFGDSENSRGFLNIKRTMTGETYVYRRQNPLEKLNYDFVIDRKKAIELRAFLLQNNSKVLTLTNWKGEIWKVLLTNNPFQFTEEGYREGPQGNRSRIPLELQGVKIN